MNRSRTGIAALLLALPLALTACSGDEGDVDVNAPEVNVSPGDVEVEAPDPNAPDVDVDADVENPEDADGEAGPDESPSG